MCNKNCSQCFKCGAPAMQEKAKFPTYHVGGVTISGGNAKIGATLSISINNDFCDPSWPCYEKCYARRIAGFRPSVCKSYDANTAVLNADRDRYFSALDFSLNLAKLTGVGFRLHVDGEVPDYDYLDRVLTAAAKFPEVSIIFMTKRHDLVNEWIHSHGDSRDSLPTNCVPRFSTWEGKDTINPYGLPEAGFIPKKQDIAGRTVCPNQTAKKAGVNWTCEDCRRAGYGCHNPNMNVYFCEH